MIIIQDRQTGTFIDEVNTLEEARIIINKFETEDKEDNNYEEEYYEIRIVNYELRYITAEVDLKYKDKIKPGYALEYNIQEMSNGDSDIIATFETLEEAKKALTAYKSSVKLTSSFASKFYLIEEYFIEENIYNEDGEWIDGGDILDYSEMDF